MDTQRLRGQLAQAKLKRVPPCHRVSDQPQCAKLIFLTFTIALSDLPTLTITDGPGYSMAALSPVQLGQEAQRHKICAEDALRTEMVCWNYTG